MKTKYTEYMENLIIADNKDWICQLEDSEKDVPLSLLIDITDMQEVTGEEGFEDYPFVMSLSIIAANPNKSLYEGEGKADRLGTIYDCNSYYGGVPVDHKFLNIDSTNKNLMLDLKAKQAKLVTINPKFGTYAAQNGQGSSFTYPQFKTHDDALAFAKSLIDSYGNIVMGMLIGFTLDAPINMIGDTGWKTIQNHVNGKEATK